MSGTLSQLPELGYDDLLAEARARLPALCPEWTDHGPADLGITLVELLAALVEMIHYRARRETEAITRAFLALLADPELAQAADLGQAIRATLAQLRTPYRAVTAADYEALTRDAWPMSPEAAALGAKAQLDRVRCLVDYNVEGQPPTAPAPGHISLIVVPVVDQANALAPLARFFEPRRLLTARLHVVRPTGLKVRVSASLYVDDDAAAATVKARALAALTRWFDRLLGGAEGKGWPLGASVYASDLYALLDEVPGVDFVAEVALTSPTSGRGMTSGGAVIGLALRPHEIASLNQVTLRVFEPTNEGWKEVTE